MRRVAVAVVTVSLALTGTSRPVCAEDRQGRWYEGPRGRTRILHLSLAVGGGAAFVLSESVFKPALAPDHCRWCDPPAIDRAVRDALRWDDTGLAHTLSNVTGYISTPVLGIGLTAAASLARDDAGWAQLIDDTIPILETVAISQVVTQIVKFSVGRARPFVRFGTPEPDQDNNLSFYSGHSALTFGITVSAGLVAHWRGSRIEPVIWAAGLPLSAATAYLRIAADRHYFTDVVTGTAVGVAAGLLIPRWMRQHGVAIVPTSSGAAIVGAF